MDESAGKRAKCPDCGRLIDVPDRDDPSPAPRPGIPVWLAASTVATLLVASGAAFFLGTRIGREAPIPQQIATPAKEMLVEPPKPPEDPSPGIVEATEIRLVGGDGKARGTFAVSPDGIVKLSLFDGNGVERVSHGVDEERAGVLFSDGSGGAAANITASREGSSKVEVRGGGHRALIAAVPDGRAKLRFTGEDGTVLGSLGLDEGGTCMQLVDDIRTQGLAVIGKDMEPRFVMGSDDNVSTFYMQDNQGRTRFTIGVLEGSPGAALNLMGADGSRQIHMSVDEDDLGDAPRLSILDEDSRTVFEAPAAQTARHPQPR